MLTLFWVLPMSLGLLLLFERGGDLLGEFSEELLHLHLFIRLERQKYIDRRLPAVTLEYIALQARQFGAVSLEIFFCQLAVQFV